MATTLYDNVWTPTGVLPLEWTWLTSDLQLDVTVTSETVTTYQAIRNPHLPNDLFFINIQNNPDFDPPANNFPFESVVFVQTDTGPLTPVWRYSIREPFGAPFASKRDAVWTWPAALWAPSLGNPPFANPPLSFPVMTPVASQCIGV